jgi:glutathione peroxidase
MKSIYEIPLASAESTPNYLEQYKGKVTLVVNTTVGCGNANQLEILQRLQEKYSNEDFEIIAVPTNDYCGPGITKGKWSEGITCGIDSKNYGEDVYGTTFKYSEMVSSIPHEKFYEMFPHFNSDRKKQPPHELYAEISLQMKALREMKDHLKDSDTKRDFLSPWLNMGFYGGSDMGGNYEKYLIDRDGYVMKHFECSVLNYDVEKTYKEFLIEEGTESPSQGLGRTTEIFNEEYDLVCSEIEKAIAGARSAINI